MINSLLNVLAIVGLLIACVVAVGVLICVIFFIFALVGKIISLVKENKGEGGR